MKVYRFLLVHRMCASCGDTKTQSVSAAVLAGGQSRRMGRDKSLLRLGGQPLIERVLDRLACLSDDLLVVTNTPEKYGWLAGRVRFVPDPVGPGKGPLAGIAGALQAACHDPVIVVATDMPFLNVELLRYLARLSMTEGADVVVPVVEPGRPETMHAVYRKRCLPAIEAALAAGQFKIITFFPHVRVREVPAEELRRFDPDLLSFWNANTPEEWEQARRLVEGGA